ncbi:MAG: thioredoxin family protein [Paludibacter sp.]|nr:thioredoxin family protein [Paludibacter sp.]
MSKTIRYFVLLFLLVNAQMAFSQSSISFSEEGLQAAFDKAKVENKPVMLWCYATWCPHCKHMKSTVFINTEVANFYNTNFICVSQDMENEDGIKLNDSLKIRSFPTFIFYNPTGKMVYRVEGEFKPSAFIEEGKNALTPRKQLPFLKQEFEKDISNSSNCYFYIRALKKAGLDVSNAIKQYFNTQSDKQLLSEINWRIITNGVSDLNSRELQFVIKHQKEFVAITSPERVRRKLNFEVNNLLNPLIELTDTINYPIKRKIALQIHSFSTDSLVFTFDLKFYESTNNWKAYQVTAVQSAQIYAWRNPDLLSDIANNFLKNISNTKALLQAEGWAQRALALDEEYDTYLISSRIYLKLGNKLDATQMAIKAKELSKKLGWEGTESEKLLKELNMMNKQ